MSFEPYFYDVIYTGGESAWGPAFKDEFRPNLVHQGIHDIELYLFNNTNTCVINVSLFELENKVFRFDGANTCH